MGNFFKLLASSCLVVFLLNACSNPSELGSDLLAQDQENVIFTDTIDVITSTTIRDSVISHSPGSGVSSFAIGNLSDPIFGNHSSDVFMQITPANLNFPILDGIVIDSVILTLAIDSARSVGTFTDNLQFDVFEMSDSFSTEEPIYSHETFPTKPMAVGSYDGIPSFIDDIPLYEADGDTILQTLMVKIPIDNDLGRVLIDSTTLQDLDKTFFGFHLKTVSSQDDFLSIFGENPATGLIVYYTNFTDGDTLINSYRFLTSGIDVRTMNLETDISGTVVEDYINGTNLSQERTYVQGLSGPDVKVDISDILSLGPIIVNEAVIEFTVANDDGTMSGTYLPIEDLVLSRLNDDDVFTGIDDNLFGQAFFGGEYESLSTTDPIVQGHYELIISDYLQKIVDGDQPPVLYLRALPKINTTRRTVLFGNASSLYKPKLELTFTRIN